MRSLVVAPLLLLCGVARAEPLDLQILSNAPSGEAAWKMEIISFQADGMPEDQVPKSITLCMDPANRFGSMQGLEEKNMAEKRDCEQKVLENGSKRAKVSMKCKAGLASIATITKESDKAFRVQAQTTAKGQSMKMDLRYRHQGACPDASSSPFGSGAVRGVEMSDAQCKQMRAQMGAMKPDAACGKLSGEAKAQCMAQMTQAQKMIDAACPQ